MTIDELARNFAKRTICPLAPGHEPATQYERGAVQNLTRNLLAFWAEARSVEIDGYELPPRTTFLGLGR